MAEHQENQNAEISSPADGTEGRISLNQARVVAMRAAAENPGAYRRRFRNIPMAFQVVEDAETEDHYLVTLSFQPQGQFTLAPGLEEFSIDMQGRVARRRVINPPGRSEGRRLPAALIGIALAVVVGGAVGGVFAATSGGGAGDGDTQPVVAALPTSTARPASPTAAIPTLTAAPVAVAAAAPAPTFTPVPPPISTAATIVQPTPTPGVTTEPSPIPPMLELELDPSAVILDAGSALALSVRAFDQSGVEVPSPSITWSLTPEVGQVGAAGGFTASIQAGVFPAGIRVDVTDGDATGSATLDVTIEAGPLEDIEVNPPSPVTRRGESVQLTATGYDGYRNAIGGLEFHWQSEPGISVDSSGKVTSGQQGPPTPPGGLVGWWPGNGNAEDVVEGHNGVLGGGAGYAPGVYGLAFSFDGVDDVVEVDDVDRLDLKGDVTMHFWAKRSDLGGPAVMVVKGAGIVGNVDVPTVYVLKFGSATSPGGEGDYLWGGFERANGSDVFLVAEEVADALFHHYAYVRAGNSHRLYLDGVPVANDTFIGLAGSTPGLALSIGSGPTGGRRAERFAGIIDEVQIFDRALSDTEIKADYLAAGPKGSYQVTVWAIDEGIERNTVVTVVVE